jgi:hypothetical protein
MLSTDVKIALEFMVIPSLRNSYHVSFLRLALIIHAKRSSQYTVPNPFDISLSTIRIELISHMTQTLTIHTTTVGCADSDLRWRH